MNLSKISRGWKGYIKFQRAKIGFLQRGRLLIGNNRSSGQWRNIVKILRDNYFRARILYSTKLAFKYNNKIKVILDILETQKNLFVNEKQRTKGNYLCDSEKVSDFLHKNLKAWILSYKPKGLNHKVKLGRFLVTGSTVSLPSSYVEALTPASQNVTVFGDGAFKELIKVKWGH